MTPKFSDLMSVYFLAISVSQPFMCSLARPQLEVCHRCDHVSCGAGHLVLTGQLGLDVLVVSRTQISVAVVSGTSPQGPAS